jgi:sugar phosphate isomerase/epimerase
MQDAKVEAIRGRCAISTIVFWGFQPVEEKALGRIADAGIGKIELLESPEQFDLSDRNSMGSIGAACRRAGLSIASYHAHKVKPNGMDADGVEKLVDVCKRQIETLQEAGGDFWASHARQADEAVYSLYGKLVRFVEGTRVRLGVENFVQPGTWVRDRMAFLRKLEHPQLGLLLDIGHVMEESGVNPMTRPGGPAAVLDMCGDKLFHLHLHGFKDGIDHHPPLCAGDEIRWGELVRELWRRDYRGHLCFEAVGLPRHGDSIGKTAEMPEKIASLLR